MVHIGQTSYVIYHTVRDLTLKSVDAHGAAVGNTALSEGDISAVAKMYASI